MKRASQLIAAAVAFGVGYPAAAIISFDPAVGSNFTKHASCHHDNPPESGTDLLTAVLHQGSEIPDDFPELLDYRIRTQFQTNWYTTINTGLIAHLEQTEYRAFDGPGSCEHGARHLAKLTIEGGMAEKQQFAWLQLYSDWGDSGNDKWILDPPSSSHSTDPDTGEKKPNDSLPFYYNYEGTNDHGEQVEGDDYTSGSAYTFGDQPHIEIPARPPHSGGSSFMLFLASWDGNTDPYVMKEIRIYGYLDWGYTYQCTPAPGSLGLVVLAGMGLIVPQRKR